jgi:hypothetical protein
MRFHLPHIPRISAVLLCSVFVALGAAENASAAFTVNFTPGSNPTP